MFWTSGAIGFDGANMCTCNDAIRIGQISILAFLNSKVAKLTH